MGFCFVVVVFNNYNLLQSFRHNLMPLLLTFYRSILEKKTMFVLLLSFLLFNNYSLLQSFRHSLMPLLLTFYLSIY